ncbi:MAG: hypothetical protein IH931_00960 [candidate division Zixibacteria bacterium]|nr:hypothetical protein [candidate division Zixibacteria bacterium]
MDNVAKNRLVSALLLFLLLTVPLSLLFVSGCSSDWQGEASANIAPTVGFINSPPESTNFSRNSVIYWWGSDPDGIIAFFRYHVATFDELGIDTPDEYIRKVDDTNWTVLEVDVSSSQPGTQAIIKLSADLDDPVNRFVLQYVFLQAFDEEGMGSTIVWRIFGRNDNPPQTVLFNPPAIDLPFVDAEQAGGIITGVKLRWRGEDLIDFPQDPPPFEFEYRLYGPYDDSVFNLVSSQFFTIRYVTSDGKVFKIGDIIIRCDTIITLPQLTECDTTVSPPKCSTLTLPPDTAVTCDTLVVSLTTPTDARGGLEDFFDIENTAFTSDTIFNSVVFESQNSIDGGTWVEKTGDTIFNVFASYKANGAAAADTTVEMNFVFWIRCRDDAQVPDIVPAFKAVRVLNPRYEREILIVDATEHLIITTWSNRWIRDDSARGFWYDVIKKWADSRDDPSLYLDTSRTPQAGKHYVDYLQTKRTLDTISIATLLKHKLVVLYNESAKHAVIDEFVLPKIYKAIDAGVNVWVMMRAAVGPGDRNPLSLNGASPNYARYFGVTQVIYSGWGCHAIGLNCSPQARIEDFIGATARQPGWVDMVVDTFRLRNLLNWDHAANPAYRWDSNQTNYGLPEVGWSIRTFGTELLYKYVSFYGPTHPLPEQFIFHAAPVAHRLNAGTYRTVHCNFTPIVLDTLAFQSMADSVLNWLYDPSLGAPTAKPRYNDSKLNYTIEESRENYRARVEEYERLHGDPEASGMR